MSQGSNPSQHQKRRPDWAALAIAVFLVLIASVIFWDSARLASVTGYSPVGPATVADLTTIETLDAAGLRWEQACGRVPVSGLLTLARRRMRTLSALEPHLIRACRPWHRSP